jgi:hypothetical protein
MFPYSSLEQCLRYGGYCWVFLSFMAAPVSVTQVLLAALLG